MIPDRDQWLEVCKPRVRFERRTRGERSYHSEAAALSDTCHDLVEDQLYSGRCRREYGEDASPDGMAIAHGRQKSQRPTVRQASVASITTSRMYTLRIRESTVKNMLLRIDGRMDTPLMVGNFCARLGNRSPCGSS
jgi:hypothetical protein